MSDDGFGGKIDRVGQADWIRQDDLPVQAYQIVAPDGTYTAEDIPDLDQDEFQDLYRWMRLERTFNERMVKLQRRGQLGTFASGRGQEASIIGSGYALAAPDWLIGMGREAGAMFLRGVSMRDLILFWRGVEAAGQYLAENNCMIAIAIGSHLPLVTGIGWGMALADEDAVVAGYFGDGATSTGAAHEAINFAGVLGVPVLFFCQNNQYAISTPFEKQTAAESVAQRAVGYGIEGIRVDGNDVLAVYDAVDQARSLASKGRPVLVESVTYRMDAHTTSDDPTRYRSEDEVAAWAARDPLDRYREFLQARGLWSGIDDERLAAEVNEDFDAAVAAADAFDPRDVEEIFAYVYDELPSPLQNQLEAFETFLEEHPETFDHIDQRPKG